MKYGISSFADETTFEKRDTSEETNVASEEVSEAATTMASPRRHGDADAVVFSIQFYGKTIGEVGMMDQDLSELDWKKFKSYLFQNLLSVNHQENICVSYSDEEGDKLPIDSDEEYQEAVKVAKKKAEVHDKMVLDITRQGGFPAMLSLVSSGIKKVSSSPPKEGGISFFKASSPKDVSGFKAVGTERKLFQGFFMPDKGPIPGHVQGVWGYDCAEAFECGKGNTATTTTTTTSVPTARTDCKRGPPVRALRNSPPNLLFKFDAPSHNLKSTTLETSASQDIFGAGNGGSTGARPKDLRLEREFTEQPPEWFTSYMVKFRAEVCEEVSDRVVAKVTDMLRKNNVITTTSEPEESQTVRKFAKHTEQRKAELEDRPQRKCVGLKKSLDSDLTHDDMHDNEKKKKKENETVEGNAEALPLEESVIAKKKDDKNNNGVKRKKLIKEEERLMKKQEKIERKKFILTSKYADEMDKASRTQEKVFAKMEGLRKKQFCSQEELSKLRKMVDKQQRFITAEQRQQRRNERKAGYQKSSKSKKINIDNKGFPVDASLLHAALQELEALAEDSTSDCAVGITTRGYDALYLKDITFPDGSIVAPGTEFVKTWRVVNNGVMSWNEKTTLCKWSQVRFRGSPAGWKLKPSMKRVVCPPLEPGQEGDISITFTAPSEPGWYATHWRFCQRGRVFGNQMWCAIHVVEEPSVSEASNTQLGNTVVNEDGESKLTITTSEMQEISASIVLQQGTEGPIFHTYTCVGLDPPEDLSRTVQPESFIIPPLEELGMQTDLGIVENYYDAEDPIRRECTESLQKLSLSCVDEASNTADERKDRDLISFEEEAEVVDSGTSTPEMVSNVSQSHSVVPLKEMAKESVESLIIKDQELKSQLKQTILPEPSQADSISMSSGSFSELDSEDQAILNESDSEGSDHEYYVVHLPDCFNTISLNNDLTELSESNIEEMTVQRCEEPDRPDSPDFLTADEDDRTTAVASDSSDDLTCPINDHDYASRSSTVSQTSSRLSHARPSLTRSSAERDDNDKNAKVSTMPDPPTDTKPFMSIPDEAIQTNVLYSTSQVPNNGSEQGSQLQKEQDLGTWTTGTDNAQNVVCEQPYSAQHKEPNQDSASQGVPSSTRNESTTNSTNPSQLPVDLVGALPDELVSIIPEDLVRGAWNTARSFITRINQEMLSPTSESPGRVFVREEESPSDQQQPPPMPPSASVPQPEEAEREITTTERESVSPLPPPMQQLEDMGFHNREVNDRLLTKYNGDVSCAVAELIVLNCH